MRQWYLFVFNILFVCLSQAQDLHKFHYEEVHMGTLFKLTVYHSSDSVAYAASQRAFARIAELDSICSDYRLDSELSNISNTAYKTPVMLSKDIRFLLVESIKFNKQSDGIFSIVSGPLTKLWRKAIRRKELPDKSTIERLLEYSQSSDIIVNTESNTIQLLKENMRLDLGGIAKGYAVDEAFKVLRRFGIEAAVVDGGGDIYVGKSPTQEKWKVVVGNEIITLEDYTAVATSGPRYKYLTVGDTTHCHIIDPRTGWGISKANEVTVMTDKCYIADALATILSIDNQIDLSHVYEYNVMINQTENIK